MANRRTTREHKRERMLRLAHFTRAEAHDFRRFRIDNPAIQQMKRERAEKWNAFDKKALRMGWFRGKKAVEWRKELTAFYKSGQETCHTARPWVKHWSHKRQTPRWYYDPFEYYEATFSQLPDEDKWESGTMAQAGIREPVVSVSKVLRQRWINDLDHSINRTTDKTRRAELIAQKQALQRGLEWKR